LDARANGRKAVFLDRDGTVNRNTHYLIDFEDFELLPGVAAALRILQDLDYRLFVVSNQSGVARGYFTYAAVEELNRKIVAHLAGLGIRIEEIVFCPHHPEGTVPEYTRVCDCRKPLPGMLIDLARRHGIDLGQSIMVGDNEIDAQAGLNAGARGIRIRPEASSQEPASQVDNPPKIKEFASLLDFAEDLREIAGRNGSMDEEQKIISELYKSGQLNGICTHLLEFVSRHKAEIRAMAGRDAGINGGLVEATKQLIQHRGSIHLPSEMADQIKEINNEIWYRGEHGDYNRSKIQEEWAMRYASMWRNFRVKEILFVCDQKADEISAILNSR
jgi:D-glycero-D-manno-heptose 1,7-bisphosphate phosphatase